LSEEIVNARRRNIEDVVAAQEGAGLACPRGVVIGGIASTFQRAAVVRESWKPAARGTSATIVVVEGDTTKCVV